ncbi:MAG: VOC family protein [Phycisphaerae bacterium]|jgi:uncharacterized glyoxalase superfamily protein PhnB
MPTTVKAIPDGYTAITPHLRIKGAAAAIEFYKKAFAAEELFRMPMPDGKVGHAELRIGGAALMLADECPEVNMFGPGPQGSGVTIHLYVEDADAVFARAVAAGATPTFPVTDMFWGDRYGKVRDPFGHDWSIATHKEDLSPEEMARRGQEAMARMGSGKGH